MRIGKPPKIQPPRSSIFGGFTPAFGYQEKLRVPKWEYIANEVLRAAGCGGCRQPARETRPRIPSTLSRNLRLRG
jgi:hypothetical protein